MNPSRRHALGACIAIPLLAAQGAAADAPASVPAAIAAELPGARLLGQGDLRWFGLRVYTAQLWIGAEPPQPERFADVPFALQLQYAMSLSGRAIADRSLEEMTRMGLGDAARRERWHRAMQALFPDVGRGDRLTGINRPGRATPFHRGDQAIGAVDDPLFGPAFFGIWLDARTVAPDLRRQLLQGAQRG
jgi:hypothetical protein